MMTYSITSGRIALQSEKSYPPLPVQAPPQWEGSAVTWVGKNAILLYGQVILDASTGDSVGDTGISNVTSQSFSAPDLVQLTYRDAQGQQRIAIVHLKADQIAEMTKPKR